MLPVSERKKMMMADRFTLLPTELQHYIHCFALNSLFADHCLQRRNRMEVAITLLQEIGGPFENKPGYCITFPVETGGSGETILDFNNSYVLCVLSYAAKVFDPNYSNYFEVDNVWWINLVIRCYSDIEITYEELDDHYELLAERGQPDAYREFCKNLISAQEMTNNLLYKLLKRQNWIPESLLEKLAVLWDRRRLYLPVESL